MAAPLVLGLLGRKRSGKDTFAERLVSEHGFERLAFADALKATMYDLNPWVRVEEDEVGIVYGPASGMGRAIHLSIAYIVDRIGWEAAKEVREVRRLLQDHGVAIRDHVSPSVWVDAVASRVAVTVRPVVITDVRFPNEMDFIRDVRGRCVRIVRPGVVSEDRHVSEVGLDDVYTDYVVRNSGSVGDLHRVADDVATFELRRI